MFLLSESVSQRPLCLGFVDEETRQEREEFCLTAGLQVSVVTVHDVSVFCI